MKKAAGRDLGASELDPCGDGPTETGGSVPRSYPINQLFLDLDSR